MSTGIELLPPLAPSGTVGHRVFGTVCTAPFPPRPLSQRAVLLRSMGAEKRVQRVHASERNERTQPMWEPPGTAELDRFDQTDVDLKLRTARTSSSGLGVQVLVFAGAFSSAPWRGGGRFEAVNVTSSTPRHLYQQIELIVHVSLKNPRIPTHSDQNVT